MSTLLLSRFSVSGAPDDPAALVMTADRRVLRQVGGKTGWFSGRREEALLNAGLASSSCVQPL